MAEQEQFGYKGNYGLELIADYRGCDFSNLTKESLHAFVVALVDFVKMERYGEPMQWEDHSGIPHLDGISEVQFITTSNVVVHALTDGRMYLNLFSCREFEAEDAVKFVKDYWKAADENHQIVTRV